MESLKLIFGIFFLVSSRLYFDISYLRFRNDCFDTDLLNLTLVNIAFINYIYEFGHYYKKKQLYL